MNLTLAVDEKLVRRARRMAEARGTSLNQVIRDYLEAWVGDMDPEAQIAEFDRLSSPPRGDARGGKFDREEIHRRRP